MACNIITETILFTVGTTDDAAVQKLDFLAILINAALCFKIIKITEFVNVVNW
jgi:hypothetical protein